MIILEYLFVIAVILGFAFFTCFLFLGILILTAKFGWNHGVPTAKKVGKAAIKKLEEKRRGQARYTSLTPE